MFLFGDPATDGGELDARQCSGRVGLALGHAHHAPHEGACDDPPVYACGVDLRMSVGEMVRAQKILDGPDTGDFVRAPEPPRPYTQPAKVLGGVAEMGEFPVENSSQSLGLHDHVAEAKVAVHDHRVDGFRAMRIEPTKGELERRAVMSEQVEDLAILLERMHLDEARNGFGGDSVEQRGSFAKLAHEDRSCVRIGFVTKDLAGDRLAVHVVHHEEAGLEHVVVGVAARPDGRYGNTGPRSRLEKDRFERHAAGATDRERQSRRVTAKYQRPGLAVGPRGGERPRLPARPAAQTTEPVDLGAE